MKKTIASFFILALATSSAQADIMYTEYTNVLSNTSVTETSNKFENIVKEKGFTLYNRIDHTKNAKSVNTTIRPSEVIIFGNPKLGSKLMQCEQSIAIDLPLKVHIYEDKLGQVWLSYLTPKSLQSRHQVKGCDKFFDKMASVLPKLTISAAK